MITVLILGCTAPQNTQVLVTTTINVDKKDVQVELPVGGTVQEALQAAQITLDVMDRVDPPLYTVLSDGDLVKVIRVREEYYIEQEIMPFEHQELKNEALPEGEKRLSQPGVNGLEEITYHRVFENDDLVSTSIVKSVVLKSSIPEIVMIGSKSALVSIEIPGKIAYLSNGNAWLIEKYSDNRKIVVSTGDLDGRIFSLSPDGKILLFSRHSTQEQSINSLWIALLNNPTVKIVDLHVANVVHFAEFSPDSTRIAYSTVEWRETAPGWQANNDLYELVITSGGFVGKPELILEPNSGGVYGWWGMDFAWSPDGINFLYSRPDGVGIVSVDEGELFQIYEITPYQTGGNWAWVPGSAWSPTGDVIYTVDIVSPRNESITNPQRFDLIAIPLDGGSPVSLASNTGMFANPSPSPILKLDSFLRFQGDTDMDQTSFEVAFLQAIFPDQSETSGYRISIMDRDGSNRSSVFPGEGAVGLNPQQVAWSPEPMTNDDNRMVAVLYNGNIWLVDAISGEAQQITGDGFTTKVDWSK